MKKICVIGSINMDLTALLQDSQSLVKLLPESKLVMNMKLNPHRISFCPKVLGQLL
jgi:hypothetical protein